jgi:hypothetical protein
MARSSSPPIERLRGSRFLSKSNTTTSPGAQIPGHPPRWFFDFQAFFSNRLTVFDVVPDPSVLLDLARATDNVACRNFGVSRTR